MRAFEVSTLFTGKGDAVLKKYIVISTSCSKAILEFRKNDKNQEKVLQAKELEHGVIIDGNYHS